jgi:hypothetical protein
MIRELPDETSLISGFRFELQGRRLDATDPFYVALADAAKACRLRLGQILQEGHTSVVEIRQTNPERLTKPHEVTNPGISPLSRGNFLQQIKATASIREFLFELRKDGHIFWVGASVRDGVTDFTKAQVFFHPTVINGGSVHAADRDYPKFTGGWSKSIQRYVAMQGGLLASVRETPLIVPFMTMAANSGRSSSYMFASEPVETLNAIVTALQTAVTGKTDPVVAGQIGVSSFSSGIGAMRLFISAFGSSGLIIETTDFDGPFIRGTPRVITQSPGATGRVISQIAPPKPIPGWLTLPAWKFNRIPAFRKQGAHAQIGWMTFHLSAMLSSMK